MKVKLGNLDKIFFSGIGGSGMSALAQLMAAGGAKVSGSDRRHDRGESPEIFSGLKSLGIELRPQDGSGVRPGLDSVVVSAAVEPDTPDCRRAGELGIPVIRRADLLAALVNSHRGICFSGTSGKSTSTALTAFVLTELGLEPNFIGGAAPVNYLGRSAGTGNALTGSSELYVVESCESDGTIVNYRPEAGVVLNIERDHHELDKLLPMFATFARATTGRLVLNADCPNTMGLAGEAAGAEVTTFGLGSGKPHIRAAQIEPRALGASFTVDGVRMESPLPGLYNISNTLASLAVCESLGVELTEFARVLPEFRGVARRFQVVGEKHGVTVIDDFAHNPSKIEAVLGAFAQWKGLRRLIAVYQPHGFGPTRFHFDGLVDTFARCLGPDDLLVLPEIYYAGGTATKDISSRDIAEALGERGVRARYFERRADSVPFIAAQAREGDAVLVMGARDDTLPGFCREILESL